MACRWWKCAWMDTRWSKVLFFSARETAPWPILPISINKCSLRMCPASFSRGAVLQEWPNAVTDPLSKGCNEHGMREIKVAAAFPSGP
jgi:hypothetical protein